MIFNYQQAAEKMEQIGQAHVLKYFAELTIDEQNHLLSQIENLDFNLVHDSLAKKSAGLTGKIEPIDVLTKEQICQYYKEYESIGLDTIRQNKVAALLFAGGQGTRLGVPHSKGMVNIGKTKELFIFECHFRNMLKVAEKAGCKVPFCIMTSEINNDETQKFLREKDYFGYDPNWIFFFIQEMFPAINFEGKYLMSSKSSIALSPNGNGDWFRPMQKMGLISKLRDQGIEWINAFAIDNVLQKAIDPVFIGATIKGGFPCGVKVVAKDSPEEKAGVICKRDGKPSIIEYYDTTNEIINSKNSKGELLYNYGVLCNYLFNFNNLDDTFTAKMPIHLPMKKIDTIDAQGNPSKPEKENGYKLEMLILDMVEIMGNCLPFEIEREKEFAPVKYNKGPVYTIETAQKLLEKAGCKI